jgi:hypothetical protein
MAYLLTVAVVRVARVAAIPVEDTLEAAAPSVESVNGAPHFQVWRSRRSG